MQFDIFLLRPLYSFTSSAKKKCHSFFLPSVGGWVGVGGGCSIWASEDFPHAHAFSASKIYIGWLLWVHLTWYGVNWTICCDSLSIGHTSLTILRQVCVWPATTSQNVQFRSSVMIFANVSIYLLSRWSNENKPGYYLLLIN